jgi:malonate transporter and related proteins
VLVMTFALPAALFVATPSAPRSELLDRVPLFTILGLVMLAVHLAWYVLARRLWQASKPDVALQALTISFPNLAGVGLPIAASSLLGPSGTVPVAVALASGSIIVRPAALLVVEMNSGKPDGVGRPAAHPTEALRRVLTKPIVLAPAVGILFSLSGLELGPVAEECLMLIGRAAPGVALFLTGLVLSSQPFRLDWKVTAATAAADVVRPLLTAAVVFTLPVSLETAKIAILMAAVPSGFFGILFAVSYCLDSGTAGSMVLASTVFSIATMAVAIAILYPCRAAMPVAILCSGQGPQHPDMFALTGERPEAADLFAHASSTLLGCDPRALVRSGTPEAIHINRTGQILCCLQALAAASALRGALSGGAIVAGYSVGEVAAWGVAGLFAMTETLDLAASRAEAMDAAAASGQGMLFVRGLRA